MNTRTPRIHRGFTLIELLGVIAILAILAAIAFPAIDNAIAKSRTATSTQNLKQFGVALKSFVADKGHYPASSLRYREGGSAANEVRQRWMNILSPYMNADVRATTNAQSNTSIGNAQGDADQSVFNSSFKDPAVSDWAVGRNNSYGYNFQYLGNARAKPAGAETGAAAPIYRGVAVRGFVNYPVQASQIQRPDKTIAVAGSDGTGATNAYRPPATMGDELANDAEMASTAIDANDRHATLGNEGYQIDPTFLPLRDLDNNGTITEVSSAAGGSGRTAQGARGIITNRHNGGTPVLFADGHVEFLLREDAYFDRNLGVFSNRLWNGFGVGNDRDGDGTLTGTETLIDPNEAWTTPNSAISTAVTTTLNSIGLNADHTGDPASTVFYGPGFPGESDTTLRGLTAGPTLPKVGPFPKLETDSVDALR